MTDREDNMRELQQIILDKSSYSAEDIVSASRKLELIRLLK